LNNGKLCAGFKRIGVPVQDWVLAIEIVLLAGALLAFAAYVFALRLAHYRNLAADKTQLLNNLSEGVYRSSIDGRQLSANRALVRLNGFASEREMLDAVNRTGTDAIALEWYVDPSRRADFQRVLHRDGYVADFVSEVYRHKTRERIWISENARLILCPRSGAPLHYEGTVRDITETVNKRQVEKRLNKLADTAPGGLFQMRVAPDGTFSMPYMSRPFCTLLGLIDDQIKQNPAAQVARIHPDDKGRYLAALDHSRRTLTPWRHTFRFRNRNSESHVWLDVNAHVEREADGGIVWSGCLSDVSEQKRLHGEVERLAYHDALTDLPNRRLLLDRLTEACKLNSRRRKHGALVFIDLDGFKAINDTHGHDAGDQFIRLIAEKLQETVRESDTIARFGGDEFVILLHDLDTDLEKARNDTSAVVVKIMANLQKGLAFKGARMPVTCSAGVTVFRGRGASPEGLIAEADKAMYRAKALGRNRYVIHGVAETEEPVAALAEMANVLSKAA
jgi:diguanylate cyclase (GGDEF)-like protein